MTAKPGSREAIREAALAILAKSGVVGLTARAVTKRAGCSTTGIYTHFGGKQGLLDALYYEGFAMLDSETPEQRSGDPAVDIVEGLLEYRRFARRHPALYQLMFASESQGYSPGAQAQARADASLAAFRGAVERACAAGAIAAGADEAALTLWGTTHGFVMLELAGPNPGGDDGEGLLRRALTTLLRGLASGASRAAGIDSAGTDHLMGRQ